MPCGTMRKKVRTQLRWKVGDLEKKSLCYYLYFRTPPMPMTAVLVMQWRSGGKSCDLPGSWQQPRCASLEAEAGKEQRFAAWFTKLQILLHKCVSRFLKSALSQRALRYALRPSAPDSDSDMTQAQDAVLHPGRLVIIRRQVVVGQEGPSPKGNRIRQRASRP